MRIAAVVSDLMLYSRIESAARVVGASLVRLDEPSSVPPDAELVLVDGSARETSWSQPLRILRDSGTRVILFGPHTDLDAHAAAREAGLSPLWARSNVMKQLPNMLRK